ncbi:MAG: hypothetical protein BAJALOKI1v1_940009 [Promethearchaeota archaeon]|nr:MAG: hypothetical protein BAJALOKI1v1_940009 [Candidatus Lokiarchaeota archaeon]
MEGRIITSQKEGITLTARLMAHYRAQESKLENPLIIDPFAKLLAGDLSTYLKNHIRVSKMDYPIVRSYYIENRLLEQWCRSHKKSQIVLLGSGLDTRAYRFQPLRENHHIIFEIDQEGVNNYKKRIMTPFKPLCKLKRISSNLNSFEWIKALKKEDYNLNIPTFWILEGLLYYLRKETVRALLTEISRISTLNSQIFADMCIPIYAEVKVGPFSKYFKWGLDKNKIPEFFKNSQWNVSCKWADTYDRGRDVGQKGLIFIVGTKMTDKQ